MTILDKLWEQKRPAPPEDCICNPGAGFRCSVCAREHLKQVRDATMNRALDDIYPPIKRNNAQEETASHSPAR